MKQSGWGTGKLPGEDVRLQKQVSATQSQSVGDKPVGRSGLVLADPPSISAFAALLYMLLFAILVLTVMLAYNQFFKHMLGDTLFWQALGKYRPQFADWYSVENADPIQGMFDVFPQGYRSSLILDALFTLNLSPNVITALVHAVYAMFMTVSTYLLARSAGTTRTVALVAGIALPIISLPNLLSPLGIVTHIYALTINYAYVQSSVLLAVALCWRVGEKRDIGFFVTAFIGFVVLADISNALGLHITLYALTAVVLGIGALLASPNRATLYNRMIWAGIVSAGLLALGMPNYILASGSDIAYQVFYDELDDFAAAWTPQFQHFLNDFYYVISWNNGPAGWPATATSTIGLACAAYFALFGGAGKFRALARTVLFLISATGIVTFFLHFLFAFTGVMYKGPNPYHMIHVFWPFHVIMIVRALHDALIGVARSFKGEKSPLLERVLVNGFVVVALAFPLTQLKPLMYETGWEISRGGPGGMDWWLRDNTVTDFLRREIGVAVGKPFRGSYNNFAGLEKRKAFDPRLNLGNVNSQVGNELFAKLGNDLTRHGLWLRGIPVLMQESVTITSQFYLMVSELLTEAEDRQIRSFIIPTEPVPAILELWGVRYILTDREVPFGTVRLTEPVFAPTDENKGPPPSAFDVPLYLVELEGANLGDYSPTSVDQVQDAAGVIAGMRQADFDGRDTVLVTEELVGGASFAPARDARMVIQRGGVDLQASSSGDSLLVLPVQYSHCWQITSGENQSVSLFRANLMQLGVRFSGTLDIKLRQVFGPLWNSGCRHENAADMERLKVRQARSR